MSSFWFCLFGFIFSVYGMSVIITQGIGPLNIFFRLRLWASNISDNLGLLFRCMLCMPTNLGIVLSLLNWFFVPFPITPFNIILNSTNLWWVAALLDGCVSGGICHFIYNIEDFIDKSTPIYEEDEDE